MGDKIKVPEGIEDGRYGQLCMMEPAPEDAPGFVLAQFMCRMVPPQHPAWDTYAISLIHLREHEGSPPPQKEYPEAEYEISLYAMDGEKRPIPWSRDTWRFLTPANVIMQFDGLPEEEAITICYLAARALINGMLPAEPSGIMGGREIWINSLRMTLEHSKHGGHPPKIPIKERQGITPSA